MVSPAPRSKNRTSSVWSSTTRTKETLVRLGKRGMAFQLRSQRSPVEIEIVDEDGALRIADVQDDTLRGPGRWSTRNSSTCGRPMFISNRVAVSPCAPAGADASGRRRLRCERSRLARPASTSSAAAQRVPLPEISLRLPSEFHSSMARVGVAGVVASAASRPRRRRCGDRRWQRRNARRYRPLAGSCARQVSRKSLRAPCALTNGIVHGWR